MKFVLVLAVLLVGVWLFRLNRRDDRKLDERAKNPPSTPPLKALDMVSCRVCDLHLPRPDAIEGKKGIYCCVEHRRQMEP